MDTIVIGDLHGRRVWEEIPDLLSYDQVIFLGDYFDAKEDISEEMQITNFFKVLELKKCNPKKVVLLIGNHDYHYFSFANSEFSGFSKTLYTSISETLDKECRYGLLEPVIRIEHFLISHAGVTKTWFSEKIGNLEGLDLSQIQEAITSKWSSRPEAFDFDKRAGASPDGDDIFQPPFMNRPNAVIRDHIPNCIQIIGHTQVQKIKIMRNHLILCDTLGYSREVLVIKDSEISVLKF